LVQKKGTSCEGRETMNPKGDTKWEIREIFLQLWANWPQVAKDKPADNGRQQEYERERRGRAIKKKVGVGKKGEGKGNRGNHFSLTSLNFHFLWSTKKAGGGKEEKGLVSKGGGQ